MKTWWLSFAKSNPDRNAGVVLVDLPDAGTFLEAHAAATEAGANPGGAVVGLPVPAESVPAEFVEAFAALPRLKVLTIDQLRSVGEIVNMDGEPR